jgi:predicted nuclease of predicted toxin-antitoxin system
MHKGVLKNLTGLTYYFDESVELVISLQLKEYNLDVVSAHSLSQLGDSDVNHLQRATQMGRVLCTYDSDFLRLAAENSEHAGIVFAQQEKMSIGSWIHGLRSFHSRLSAEEVYGQVLYLSMKT